MESDFAARVEAEFARMVDSVIAAHAGDDADMARQKRGEDFKRR